MALTQVTLPCNNSVTVRAMKLGHILCVLLQDVHLHSPTLGEASVANVTLVGLLTFQKRGAVSKRGSFAGSKLDTASPQSKSNYGAKNAKKRDLSNVAWQIQ